MTRKEHVCTQEEHADQVATRKMNEDSDKAVSNAQGIKLLGIVDLDREFLIVNQS